MTGLIITDPEEVNTILHNISEFVIRGLDCDGEHHKQWYLERIALELGLPLETIREGLDLRKGIAP